MPHDLFTHEYPLTHLHEGTMLGNSYLGLYAWGQDRTLNITVGCVGLWDHRGGMSWSAKQNYKDIRKALEAHDEAAVKAIFAVDTEQVPGQPRRPSVIPVGRLVFTLDDGCTLLYNQVSRLDGALRIYYQNAHGNTRHAVLRLDMTDKGFFALHCKNIADFAAIPAYDLTEGALADLSFQPPQRLSKGDLRGFVQPMPADPAYGLAIRKDGELFTGAFRRKRSVEQLRVDLAGSSDQDLAQMGDLAQVALQNMLPGLTAIDWDRLEQSNQQWWNDYWKDIPAIDLNTPELEELYYEGLFKFGAMTAPDGVAAGLQGPWIEDNALPPWSADYHFNINVQMCYWPAFRANHPENIRKIFDLVLSWKEQLRSNARHYVGIEDGYMLPHAVDDRCTCMGSFWSGTIDHACTAWMAQLMFDYVDYTGDLQFLREQVFDFMKGTMNVFLKTLEETPDGKLALPVSTSPEYRGSALNAWGKNASFQLAAFRRLALNLNKAAALLRIPKDPAWDDLLERLPQAALVQNQEGQLEIGLWDGLLLEESHRHHSHLAALCPFDTISAQDPQWKEIVANSIARWIDKGMGHWTGWCVPWAAMLENRLDNPDAAEFLLGTWKRLYNNIGGGSTHDCVIKGVRVFDFRPQIMQMDGMMGAVTAVQDMLFHSRQGVFHVFPGISMRHKAVAFSDMPTPGGFRLSASRTVGSAHLDIAATRDGSCQVVLHGETYRSVLVSINGVTAHSASPDTPVSLKLKAGDKATLDFTR